MKTEMTNNARERAENKLTEIMRLFNIQHSQSFEEDERQAVDELLAFAAAERKTDMKELIKLVDGNVTSGADCMVAAIKEYYRYRKDAQ